MRIKFLVPNNSVVEPAAGEAIYINPSYWMMKAHYKMYGRHNDRIVWCEPMLGFIESIDAMLQTIIDQKVDILCLGMFVWNRSILMKLAKKAKQALPHIKVIIGGPDVDALGNEKFFDTNKQIDFVVYGDGERAFTQLLDSIIDNTPLLNAVNIITPEKTFPHEVFFDEAFSKISPWLMFSEEVKQTVDKIGKEKVWICWEMSRGCPYKCSFCDWSSGLHTKVKRRKPNWQQEIDFFATLDVAALYVNDANWGIYPEDIEIHRYAVSRFDRFRAINLPKLNKKNAFEILSLGSGSKKDNGILFKISLQDIHEEILKNIDRPEVPWSQYKPMIMDWMQQHPDANLAAELMIGLPGQTVDTMIRNITEIESVGFSKISPTIFWLMLPRSPAADPDYQRKHGLVVKDLIYLVDDFKDEHEVYAAVERGDSGWYTAPTVIGSNSFELSDLMTMRTLIIGYGYAKKRLDRRLKYSKIIHHLRKVLEPVSKEQADWIQKTGIFSVKKESGLTNVNDMFVEKDLLSLLASIKQT